MTPLLTAHEETSLTFRQSTLFKDRWLVERKGENYVEHCGFIQFMRRQHGQDAGYWNAQIGIGSQLYLVHHCNPPSDEEAEKVWGAVQSQRHERKPETIKATAGIREKPNP